MSGPQDHGKRSRMRNGSAPEDARDFIPDWLAGGTKAANVKKTHRNVVGAEVRRRRKQLRWSQARFANHLQAAGLDISRSSLAKIECGVVWVGDFELLYLARVLGIRVQDLFPKIAAQEPLNGPLTTLLGTSPETLKKKTNSVAAISEKSLPDGPR